MPAAALAVSLSAQIAEFKKAFDDATKTTQKFTGTFGGAVTDLQKHQQRLNTVFDQFSGDRVAREANEYAKAVANVGDAAKLTEAEQKRVNAAVTEAIAKYAALGQQAPRSLIELEQATRKVEDPTRQLAQRLESTAAGLQTFGSAAKSVGIGMTAAITVPLVAAGASILKLGMDAVESENLVSVSFGDMGGAANAWSKELSKTLGLNEFEMRKFAGTTFNMTTSMGLARDEAFKMSTGVAKLAADMSSFRNIPMEEALEKIRAGLTGEADPLKRIGILVNETATKTEAYRVGIARHGATLTETQKIQARWSAILRQTSNDQGDLARTLESPANQLRLMKTRLEEAGTALGVSLMPIFQSFVKLVSASVPPIQSFAQTFAVLPESVKLGGVAFVGLVAAVGPLTFAMGSVATATGSLITLIPKLTTAMGVTDAVGLAGAATRLRVAIMSPTGLVVALGALATAYTLIKVGEINAQADAFDKARSILGHGVKTYQEATAAIDAFKKGQSGEQIQKATLDMATAWQKGAESAGKLGAAVGDTKIVLEGFGKSKGISDTEKGLAAAAARTKEYTEDLKKLGPAGLAAVRSEVAHGVSLKQLADDFKVSQDSLDRYVKGLATAKTAQKEFSKEALEMVDRVDKADKGTDKLQLSMGKLQIGLKGFTSIIVANQTAIELRELNTATDNAYKLDKAMREVTSSVISGMGGLTSLGKVNMDFKVKLPSTIFDPKELGDSVSKALIGAIEGGGNVAAAGAAALGQHFTTGFARFLTDKKELGGKAIGGFLGGAINAVLPGIGALLGPLVGKITDVFAGLFNRNRGRDLVEDFARGFGGFTSLQQQLQTVFDPATANRYWTALTQGVGRNNPEQAKTLIDGITKAMENQKAILDETPPSFADVTAAAERYGLQVTEIGDNINGLRVSETAAQAVKDWRLMERAGADMSLVAAGMADEMQNLVIESLRWGHDLPLSMRPILERLIEMGLLTDEAGNKLEDLQGIKWAKPLTESVDQLVSKMDQLIDKITLGLGGALSRIRVPEIEVPYRFQPRNTLPSGDGEVPAFATGGIVTRPTMALIGEAGPEAVVPLARMGRTGSDKSMLDKLTSIDAGLRGLPQTLFRTMRDAAQMA